MNSFVADTRALLWYLFAPAQLSANAAATFTVTETSDAPIYVPSIVIVELRYLIEKRRFNETQYDAVLQILNDDSQLPRVAQLDSKIADTLRNIPRSQVPDMPDRIIAATALHLNLPLVTRDGKIRASGIATIW